MISPAQLQQLELFGIVAGGVLLLVFKDFFVGLFKTIIYSLIVAAIVTAAFYFLGFTLSSLYILYIFAAFVILGIALFVLLGRGKQ